jgi:hypothetical protein
MLAIAALLCAFSAGSAKADMIRIPQCPEGWEGRRVGHGGRCFPRSCESNAQCGAGASCRRIKRCFREVTLSSGRSRSATPRRMWVPEQQLCRSSCPDEMRCQHSRECVAAAPASHKSGLLGGAALSILLVGWGAIVVWRRRQPAKTGKR